MLPDGCWEQPDPFRLPVSQKGLALSLPIHFPLKLQKRC